MSDAARRTTHLIQLAGRGAIVVASLYFIFEALRFFSFDPQVLGKYFRLRWVIMGHITGGAIALLLGPIQLYDPFRTRYPKAHRIVGRVYVGAIAVGAACALTLASTTAPAVNWPYAVSLDALAAVWVVSTGVAWRTAVRRRFVEHREWAIRSYIATVAFVAQSLTIEIPFLRRHFVDAAASLIWLSWTVPMFVYDCLRAMRRPR